MTSREYLKSIYEEIRTAERALNRKIQRYEQEYSRPFGSGIDYSKDKVQTSMTGSGMDEWYIRLEEMRVDIYASIGSLCKAKRAYTGQLSDYPILCLRYVQGYSWEKIARELRIRDKAIREKRKEEYAEFDEKWRNSEKSRENERKIK